MGIASLVLAAGLGKRMRSSLPKVLHSICGKPMLSYPLDVLNTLKVEKTVVIIGHGGEVVKDYFSSTAAVFVYQERQLGTGHAVLCAEDEFSRFSGDILILSGDVPLITKETIKGFIALHRSKKAVLSFITAVVDNPSGYGRVLRDDGGAVLSVIEEKDASVSEKAIKEVNTGIYLVCSEFLFKGLKLLNSKNAQGEYYLPDLIPLTQKSGGKVAALTLTDFTEAMGVNNRVELAQAEGVMRRKINHSLMLGGVTIIDPNAVYIQADVKIGRDTTIYPNVFIEGKTSIGPRCIVEEGCKIQDSTVGSDTVIKSHSMVERSRIGKGVTIGPFARLRPDNSIADGAKIGNFVEIKKTRIGKGTKVNHLSYIGDSVIGSGVNVGAGTITCNYDGVSKHITTIHDGAFIGSDTQLVAPVQVGKGAYIGSGSTITKDVPPGSLALSRTSQRIVEGWARMRRKKKEKK